MTNLADFDRSLADFLADGPTTAPEAPVIAAMAHARTTPRRPDPLRRFRDDVMVAPRRPFGLRPALVLGLLALLAAGIAVAVGSRPSERPAVVVPPPTPTPSPVATASAGPSTAIPFERQISMLVSAGAPFLISVTDETGDLVDAASVQPGDGASVDASTIQVAADPADPAALIVTWQGTPCETGGSLRVGETGRIIEVGRQQCTGDALPLDRVVRLQFASAVTAGDWSSTFVEFAGPSGPTGSATTGGPPVPIGSPAVPPVHVVLVDNGGNATSVDVVDESGLLTAAVSGPAAEGASVDAFDATNDTATTLRLTWLGSPCDTVHRLTIDPTLTVLTLDRPLCHGDSIGVDRTLLLTFSRPVDATSLNTSLRAGRGGVDMPTWTTAAPDSAGNRYDLTLADPGYVVDSLEGSYDPAIEADGAGPAGILIRTAPFTFRLIWLGPACATNPALSIDPSGDRWQLANAPCTSAAADVLRMVDVTLGQDRTTVPAVEAVVAP
jgi:hypothetical protein